MVEERPARLIEWSVFPGYQDYLSSLAAMEARAIAISEGTANECVWLLEHPALFTAGTSAKDKDLLDQKHIPVFKTNRGGQFTYHGPGQRIVYTMLDVAKRGRDVRAFVNSLERWVIQCLERFNVKGERRAKRVGVWIDRTRPGGPITEDKIAAIGIRLKKWVSYHGFAINVEPNLDHFSGIVPCGISEPGLGVTSLVDLGLPVTMDDVDEALESSFLEIFDELSIINTAPPALVPKE
ncbi:MAG: lipoyl(octanoyl) transferase LipB [Pseudomonadota bacterium]